MCVYTNGERGINDWANNMERQTWFTQINVYNKYSNIYPVIPSGEGKKREREIETHSYSPTRLRRPCLLQLLSRRIGPLRCFLARLLVLPKPRDVLGAEVQTVACEGEVREADWGGEERGHCEPGVLL